MHYSNVRQDSYITCVADYEHPERAGLNPEEYFQFDTLEEAEKVRAEVEAYARNHGDDFSSFGVESYDFQRDLAEEALRRMRNYRTVKWIITENERQCMVFDMTEKHIDTFLEVGELDVVKLKDMDNNIIEAMKESLGDDECFAEELEAIIVKHVTEEYITYVLCTTLKYGTAQ